MNAWVPIAGGAACVLFVWVCMYRLVKLVTTAKFPLQARSREPYLAITCEDCRGKGWIQLESGWSPYGFRVCDRCWGRGYMGKRRRLR